jgi:nicotinate-nucleotide adenylyltransferase
MRALPFFESGNRERGNKNVARLCVGTERKASIFLVSLFQIPRKALEYRLMRRSGLFGGSFDPIHIGHLILARDAREQLELDRVVFIPAAISPHKLDRTPAPASVRLEMLRAAVEGEEGFEVDDCELAREGPSFTIDTVRELRSRYPDDELFYFIGQDNLAKLETWKEIGELRRLVQFVVLAREEMAEGCEFPRVSRQVAVSSTEVRKRVAHGLSIRYLLPLQACEVVHRTGLYRNE